MTHRAWGIHPTRKYRFGGQVAHSVTAKNRIFSSSKITYCVDDEYIKNYKIWHSMSIAETEKLSSRGGHGAAQRDILCTTKL
jgi:hypothetical protein